MKSQNIRSIIQKIIYNRKPVVLSVLIIQLLFVITASAQQLQWGKAQTSTDSGFCLDLVSDAAGNSFLVGSFTGTMDLDPGIGVTNRTAASIDGYFTKLNSNGDFVWGGSISGPYSDACNAITLDNSDNVIIAGTFSGYSIDLDPGPGVYTVTSTKPYNIYVLKLDPNGNLIWALKLAGYIYTIDVHDIIVDSNDNIYLTGYYDGTCDFDPGPGTYNLTAIAFNKDAFLAKLSPSGSLIWARSIGGSGYDIGRSLAFDTNGDLFVAGEFTSVCDFDPSFATYNLTSNGSFDFFIAKYTRTGNFISAISFGNTGNDVAEEIAIDNFGSVYMTGTFYNTVDFDPGTGIETLTAQGWYDAFIAKYDNSLNYQWALQLSGPGYSSGRSIAVDDQNNIINAGDFLQSIDMDPDSSVLNLYPVSAAADFYTAKFSSNGQLLWCKQGGGIMDDGAWTVSASTSGVVQVGGYFRNSVNIDMPGSYILNGGPQSPMIFQLNSSIPLPVEWLNVSAECKAVGKVEINWMTATETNCAYYTIFRTDENNNTIELGKVTGQGNSSVVSEYSFIDQYNSDQTIYYTIRQTDFDGKIVSAKMVAAQCKQIPVVSVYPNPAGAGDHIIIENLPSNTFVEISNSIGETVYKNKIETSGHFTLPASLFGSGFYTISVTNFGQSEGSVFPLVITGN